MKKLSALCICFRMVLFTGLHAQTFTLVHDGIERSYMLHVPSSYTGSEPMPLVIGFHPYGSSGEGFESLTLFSRKSDEEGFIIVYPDATGTPSEWNVGIGLSPETLSVDDVGFVSALIDRLLAECNIDPDRVYTVGFSNGSIMSHRIAAELSGKVTAIGAVAAQGTTAMMEGLQPDRPVGIIHIHMMDDGSVDYDGGELNGIPYPAVQAYLGAWAVKNGCQGNSRTFEGSEEDGYIGYIWGSAGIHGNVVHYRLEFGGHSWSFIPISATDKIWTFFESQVAGSSTAVDEIAHEGMPIEDCRLSAFPNPFNGGTEIRFELKWACDVLLCIYNARGRRVRILAEGSLDPGEHTRMWDGKDDDGRIVSSGLYFSSLYVGSRHDRMKMLFVQ